MSSVEAQPGCRGGCVCGAVSFRTAGPPRRVLHCHCGQCRRASGAAFSTWASFAREDFAVSGQSWLAVGQVTPNGRRHFCKACGTHLYTEDQRLPEVYGVPAGIVEPAGCLQPEGHFFVDDKAAWVVIADGLPCFGGLSGFEPLPP